MKRYCVQLAISLFVLVLWLPPGAALADTPLSPALIHATKPAVAHDLARQQRAPAKHHGQQAVHRSAAKSGAH